MKYLLVLLAAFIADTPTPKVTVTTTNTTGPNFWVKIAVSVQGGPDSVLYSVRQGTSTVIASSRRSATVLRDSFSLVKPAIGGTSTGNGCAQTKRRGLLSGVACKPYSFTTPDAPPPDPVIDVTTDTLLVALKMVPRPPLVLAAGTSYPVCLITSLPSGRAGYRGPRSALCDSVALTRGPAPTVTGQSTIDRSCFSLSVQYVSGDPAPVPVITTPVPCAGLHFVMAPHVSGMALPWRRVVGEAP